MTKMRKIELSEMPTRFWKPCRSGKPENLAGVGNRKVLSREGWKWSSPDFSSGSGNGQPGPEGHAQIMNFIIRF